MLSSSGLLSCCEVRVGGRAVHSPDHVEANAAATPANRDGEFEYEIMVMSMGVKLERSASDGVGLTKA